MNKVNMNIPATSVGPCMDENPDGWLASTLAMKSSERVMIGASAATY
jgi:hypothetical protein